jgi:hypothetical protein
MTTVETELILVQFDSELEEFHRNIFPLTTLLTESPTWL